MTVLKIVCAEDDLDDRLLLRDALSEIGAEVDVEFVGDGIELLDHLDHAASSGAEGAAPSLILLDLNMPRMDGREALARLKADPRWRAIPAVILTTSGDEADVEACYDAGANTYIVKPRSYQGLVDALAALHRYWVDTALLPAGRMDGRSR